MVSASENAAQRAVATADMPRSAGDLFNFDVEFQHMDTP
jgi:hypothetical protein